MAVKRGRHLYYIFIFKITFSVVTVILLTKLELVFMFCRSITGMPVVKAKKLGLLSLPVFFTQNIIFIRSV